MSDNTKTFRKGKLTLTADKRQVFPDDPGNGTPLMVDYDGKYYASYNCAVNEGYLHSGDNGDKRLSDKQIEWLSSVEAEAEAFLEASS